jgi:hypothetical protein
MQIINKTMEEKKVLNLAKIKYFKEHSKETTCSDRLLIFYCIKKYVGDINGPSES